MSRSDAVEKHFSFGSHLKQGDAKAVKKTVSGFIKLIHPDRNYTKDDVKEYLEMRCYVKEQLKKIGGMEFWDISFSYLDKENQQESFISLPEQRGFALVKIEVISTIGNGKVSVTGTNKSPVKGNIMNVYQYIKANEKTLLNGSTLKAIMI